VHLDVRKVGRIPDSGGWRILGRDSDQAKAKVERYQRIMADDVLYAREFISADARSATIAVWNTHDNDHRPHSGAGGKQRAVRLRESVTHVRPSYS